MTYSYPCLYCGNIYTEKFKTEKEIKKITENQKPITVFCELCKKYSFY